MFKEDFCSLSIMWKAWLLLGLGVIFVTSYCSFAGFTTMFAINTIAGLCAIPYVVGAAVDKKSSMFFGMFMATLYGIIAFSSGLYGDAMQNIFYQLPVLVCGFLAYGKTNILSKFSMAKVLGKMEKWHIGVLYTVVLIAYSFFLIHIGDISPILDAFTTITAMFAVVLLAMRNKYQWILWVSVNTVSSYIWWTIGGFSIMSSMWIFFLFNSFIGLYKNLIKK